MMNSLSDYGHSVLYGASIRKIRLSLEANQFDSRKDREFMINAQSGLKFSSWLNLVLDFLDLAPLSTNALRHFLGETSE